MRINVSGNRPKVKSSSASDILDLKPLYIKIKSLQKSVWSCGEALGQVQRGSHWCTHRNVYHPRQDIAQAGKSKVRTQVSSRHRKVKVRKVKEHLRTGQGQEQQGIPEATKTFLPAVTHSTD